MRVRRGRDSDSAKETETAVPTEPEEVSQESVPPADPEPEKGPETDPETEDPPAAEGQPEKLFRAEAEYPDPPLTFEQFLMSVAVRVPELDGASEAMARDVLREKGFHHVKAWRLPDGSILITKG